MKWNKYRLATTTEAVDLISYTLAEMGIEGIEIEDKVPLSEEDKKRMFIDLLPDLEEDDGKAYVSFYIEPEKDHDSTLEEVLAAVRELADFVDIGEATIEKSQTEDIDWMNNWKKYWKPFKVDEHIIIKPTWETVEDVPEDTLVVELDPGTAFGTGTHHTTRLCITQLKKYMQPGQSVLDVGCGPGNSTQVLQARFPEAEIIGIDSSEEMLQAAEEEGVPPFLILLDGIEDPHNLGAIIRTANLAGAHGVIIPKHRAAGLTATVAKTSAGALNYTPVAKVTNLGKTMEELKEKGMWFVCADMGGESMYRLDLKGPMGLVIGNEGSGVSRLVKEKCDFIASIPMKGDIDSLNASVAAGVLAYEIVRQRLNVK